MAVGRWNKGCSLPNHPGVCTDMAPYRPRIQDLPWVLLHPPRPGKPRRGALGGGDRPSAGPGCLLTWGSSVPPSAPTAGR